MDLLFILDVISRVTHVGTAIALIGGSLFIAAVLLPSLQRASETEATAIRTSIHGRWRWFVHIGILLFLLSGFYNYFRAIPQHDDDGIYHMLLGIKMLLALIVFFLAAALVGRSAALQRFRDRRATTLKILLTLAAIIVVISGYVKIRGPVPAPAIVEPQSSS